MSAPVLVFRTPGARRSPASSSSSTEGPPLRIAVQATRLHAMDPEIAKVVENLIDDLMCDLVQWGEPGGANG
jgi:hypothetical protein